MTLPTRQTDVWKLASQEDKLKALILLAGLPAREADDADVDKAAYYIALEGVTRHGLVEAVKAIHRGALGHTFFPTTVELRQQCDAVMSWHVQEQRRIDNTRRQMQERHRFDEVDAQRTPEARARVSTAYAAFCAGYEAQKPQEPGIYLDPELVAQVPDAPTSFKRAKSA